MKRLIMTVVALMGATTLFAQTDVVATFQQGVANAKAQNYNEAIAQFQEIIDASWDIEEPDVNQQKAIQGSKKFIVTCYNKMGIAAYNDKNYEEAINYYERFLKTKPKDLDIKQPIRYDNENVSKSEFYYYHNKIDI